MKIELNKFNRYVTQFLKSALAPAAKSSLTKFKIGWAVGSGKATIAEGDERYRSLAATGVIGPDGAVDVDQLRRCVDSGLEFAGDLRIDELGINIEKPEIDRFFKLLETGVLS